MANAWPAAAPVLEKTPQDVDATVGSRVQFDCIVNGDPRPTIKWHRDSIPISLTTSHKHQVTGTGTLVILDVDRRDDGVYECIAENIAGSVRAFARLAVSGKYIYRNMFR